MLTVSCPAYDRASTLLVTLPARVVTGTIASTVAPSRGGS